MAAHNPRMRDSAPSTMPGAPHGATCCSKTLRLARPSSVWFPESEPRIHMDPCYAEGFTKVHWTQRGRTL